MSNHRYNSYSNAAPDYPDDASDYSNAAPDYPGTVPDYPDAVPAEDTYAPETPRPPRRTPPRKPPSRRARRSGRGWRKFVAVYSLVILLAGAAGLGIFYKYLGVYEATRPVHVMDALMEEKTEDDWLAAMLAQPALPVTEFENAAEILQGYFDASCRGGRFTYRESAGLSTRDAPVFTVKSGSADVARVYLKSTGSAGFGLHHWEVDRIEGYISQYSLASATVRIEALDGSGFTLNGKSVPDTYIVERDLPCENLSPLESRYAEPPTRVLYEIGGLYGQITVADSTGRAVSPAEGGETRSLRYALDTEGPYSLDLTVPAQAQASVCGTPLTEAEITSRSGGLLAGLTKYVDEDNGFVTYQLDGLYRQPEITVTAPEGRTLEAATDENGRVTYSFAGDEKLAAAYQEFAESFFNYYISYGAGRDDAFFPLLSRILPGTALYTYIQDSTAAMYWASATEVSYDELVYDHFVAWGDRCFTCRVSYKASLSSQAWYESYNYDLENSYDLAFVKEGDQWLAAAMTLVAE